jgi:hypothetical protein
VFQSTRGGTEWLLSDDKGNVLALLTVNHAGTNLTFMDEAEKGSVAPQRSPGRDSEAGLF